MFRTRHTVNCKEIQHISLGMFFVLVCFHPLLLCECLEVVHYSAAESEGRGQKGALDSFCCCFAFTMAFMFVSELFLGQCCLLISPNIHCVVVVVVCCCWQQNCCYTVDGEVCITILHRFSTPSFFHFICFGYSLHLPVIDKTTFFLHVNCKSLKLYLAFFEIDSVSIEVSFGTNRKCK